MALKEYVSLSPQVVAVGLSRRTCVQDLRTSSAALTIIAALPKDLEPVSRRLLAVGLQSLGTVRALPTYSAASPAPPPATMESTSQHLYRLPPFHASRAVDMEPLRFPGAIT